MTKSTLLFSALFIIFTSLNSMDTPKTKNKRLIELQKAAGTGDILEFKKNITLIPLLDDHERNFIIESIRAGKKATKAILNAQAARETNKPHIDALKKLAPITATLTCLSHLEYLCNNYHLIHNIQTKNARL